MYNLLFIFYFIVLSENQKSKYKYDTFNDQIYFYLLYLSLLLFLHAINNIFI